MSSPIIPGEVLINRREIETAEVELAEKIPLAKRKWFRRLGATVAGFTAYGTFVALDNAVYYYDTAQIHADDGTMIDNIDGCEEFPKIQINTETNTTIAPSNVTPEQIKVTLDIEEDFKNETSAAQKFTPKGFSVREFFSDWHNVHKNEQFGFESEISGMDIHVYSDRSTYPFHTEPEELGPVIDELIHSSLNPEVDYGHITVDAYADCLYWRFVNEDGPRELENKRLNLYIPSTPGVCFSNNLVQKIPEGASFGEFCDALGVTYKGARLALRPFFEYKRDWMVVMSHKTDPDEYEPRISKLLVHEGTHIFMQYAGVPMKHTPNERLAEYQEDQTIESLYSEGIPVSISYPQNRLTIPYKVRSCAFHNKP